MWAESGRFLVRDVKKVAGAVAGVAVAVCIVSFAQLDGLTSQAVCALGVLSGAVVWWVFGVLPELVVAFIMAVLFIMAADVPVDVVFGAFSNSVWWLLVAAYGLGLGMRKSGLLARMAHAILRVFPRTFESQAAGLIVAGTLVGPLIPSLSAKAAMLAPLSLSISDSMGYARKSREANGLFLAMFTGIRNVGPAVISASIVGYGLVALLPADVAAEYDMLHWFLAMLPWFIVVSVLNYLAIVAIYGSCARRRRANAGVERACFSARQHAGCDASGGVHSADAASADSRIENANSAPVRLAEETFGQREPMSPVERRMLIIVVACVGAWVLEPLLGVPSYVVALCALVAMFTANVIDMADFRSGIAWNSLLFIGVVLGLADVFAYLGIDEWVVGLCSPLFTSLAANPYAFVVGIAVATIVLRFLIVSEMAYINILMAFMVPLSSSLGIDPWVVGVCAYATVNPWFVRYQNPIYLTAYYAVDGAMASHREMARYCALYLAICVVGLVVSVPFWQAMGIL